MPGPGAGASSADRSEQLREPEPGRVGAGRWMPRSVATLSGFPQIELKRGDTVKQSLMAFCSQF